MCECPLVRQNAADVWGDLLARPLLRLGRDRDGGVFVVLLVELIELGLYSL